MQTCDKNCSPPCEVKKSMLFAGDQWTFAIWIALLMQTYDKSYCHTLGGELQMFTGPQRKAYFCFWNFTFFQLFEDFSTFVTHLHEYGHPDCKCSLVPSRKHTFFHLTRGVNNFCHTSAGIWPSSLQMFTGPQREAYFFSRKFTPEYWRRFGIMFSRVWSFSTLKSIRRVSKIVHLPKSMNFGTVISNTLRVITLKSIRRNAKIGHLKPENAPNALPMQVWSIRSLLKS